MTRKAQETSPLLDRQRRFVEEYLVDLNATQAAIRAGYNPKTAKSMGHENLQKPEIAAAVKQEMDRRGARTGIDQDYVLNTIANTLAALTPNPEKNAARIFQGCELLGRHFGMWKDRVEHTGKDGAPIEVNDMTETELARRIAFALQQGAQAAKTH